MESVDTDVLVLGGGVAGYRAAAAAASCGARVVHAFRARGASQYIFGFNVPLVVRLEGTNVELAREMLAKSGRPIISANDLTDAAKKVVASLKA